MKRILNLLLLTLIAVFFMPNPRSLAQDVDEDADAVFQDVLHEYTLDADGNTTYSYEHHLRFLSLFAVNRAYGESFIVYNPKWQTLRVTHAETKMADGKLVKAPFNACNEVLPGFVANAAPYMNLKEMVVTHTGLERNAVVNFGYTIDTKKGMLPGLTGKVLCGDRSPIRKLTIKIRIPSKDSLRFVFLHGDVKHTVVVEGKTKLYTWELESIRMMAVEAHQPSMEQYLPVLYFTTATGKESVQHVLSGSAKPFALNANAATLVKSITQNCKTPTEKALTLRAYVEASVGQIGGDLCYTGFRAMSAQETFDRNVGTTLDRAVLLVALCRLAELPAVAVLGCANDDVGFPTQNINDDFFSCLPLFSLPAVQCKGIGAGDADLLLDPNAPQPGEQAARFAGRRCMRIADEGIFPLVLSPAPELQNVGLLFNGMINEDETLNAQITLVVQGLPAMESDTTRWIGLAKSALTRYGQGVTVMESGVREKSMQRVVCGISGKSKAPLVATGDLYAFTLPQAPGGIADLHLALADFARSTPVEFPRPFREGNMLTLRLPPSWKCATIPLTLKIKNDVGEVMCDFKNENGTLLIKRSLALNRARIPADKYKELRALVNAWLDPSYTTLFLEKVK